MQPEGVDDPSRKTGRKHRAESPARKETEELSGRLEQLTKRTEELALENQGLQNALSEQRKLAEGYLDRLMRMQAEFDNYRKRADRERAEITRTASENVVKPLVDVSENLERAIEASIRSGPEAWDSLVEGVRLTLEQLNEILRKEGLSRIEAVGKPFDTRYHEAVCRVESDEHPENTVVQEYMKGYLLNSKVIRPAKVAVSCGHCEKK